MHFAPEIQQHFRKFETPFVDALAEGHPYLIQLTCHLWLKHQTLNGKGLDFELNKSATTELWQLSRVLPHPAVSEFARRVRDLHVGMWG